MDTVAQCDTDGDGTPDGNDPDDADPCVPVATVAACDADEDGTPADTDPDDADPCGLIARSFQRVNVVFIHIFVSSDNFNIQQPSLKNPWRSASSVSSVFN